MQVRKDCIWAFFVFRHPQQVVRGHAIELSQRCHCINAEVGHIVALIFRQCRFGQTRLLCQRFQLQIPLHTQVFEPFSQCQLDVHGRTSDVFCTVYHFRQFLSISVEFCSFCIYFPTLWIYGTAAIVVLSYRQKENILTPQQRTY